MNILVVTANPLEDSLCTALSRHAIKKLESLGHDVVIENLYANKFNPVLSPDERVSYYQKKYDQSKVQNEIARLNRADALVMVFPTWWFNFPAILKGWFDRIWIPTVAYEHATDFGPIKPKLNNLSKAFVITTLGAPWWVDYCILWRPVKRIIRFALLGACTRNCKLKYLSFYKCENVSDKRINSFYYTIDRQLTYYFNV
jgi:putative NADPH-quinone reductase